MKNNIAIYARVSSDKQVIEGTIESQVAAVQEFAKQNGLAVDPDLIFLDNGFSGASFARPGLDALRDKAAIGEINQILVLNPDRLARNFPQQLMLTEEFQRLGVEIQFVNRKISKSPEDQLLLQIQGVVAEYEREKIMERHRRGKLHMAKAGKINVLARAPYGYAYIPATNNEDARYEILPSEAAVVQMVYQMLVEQRMSLGQIGIHLTKANIPSRNNVGRWTKTVIRRMLTNPAYMGQAAYRKTEAVIRRKPRKLERDKNCYPKRTNSSYRVRSKEEWIYINVPAIVSKDLFNKVQERLEENQRFSSRNNKKREYLLTSLLSCKECGHSLYGRPSSAYSLKSARYYRCAGQDSYRWSKGRICSSRPIRVEVLDNLVWDQTKKLIEQPELIIKEYMARIEKKQKQQSEFQQLIAKKARELKQQELEKERLLDLYQSGQVSLMEIENRLKSIRTKIKKLQDEAVLLEREGTDQIHQLQLIEQFQDFTKRVTTNLNNLSFEEKKKIVQLLVEEVCVNYKTSEITVRHILPLQNNVPLSNSGK